jgi:hypothetical protein
MCSPTVESAQAARGESRPGTGERFRYLEVGLGNIQASSARRDSHRRALGGCEIRGNSGAS